MKLTGGCHCGAIRYEVEGEPLTHALCHCSDCRRHSGAPMVGWNHVSLRGHQNYEGRTQDLRVIATWQTASPAQTVGQGFSTRMLLFYRV